MPPYTRLSLDDLSELLGCYGNEATRFDHLSNGVENTNYRVETSASSRDCVVTVLENRDVSSAQRYVDFLASMENCGVPLPKLWVREDGNYLSRYQDKPVIVSDYVSGDCFNLLPAMYLYATGQTLAAVHETADVAGVPDPVVRLGRPELERIRSFSDLSFVTWLLDWHDQVSYVVTAGTGTTSLTHGDLFADNMVVTPESRIVILDWENGALDFSELDLGMALLGLSGVDSQFRPDRAQLLLDGYRAGRDARLSHNRLRDVTIYAALFTAYHRYLKHELYDPTSGKQGYYREIPKFVESLTSLWPSTAASIQ